MALMMRARDLGEPVDWLLRCRHNRTLSEGGKLWSRVTDTEPLGEIRFRSFFGKWPGEARCTTLK